MSSIKFNIPLLARILSRQAGLSVEFSPTATTASINFASKKLVIPTALCSSGTDVDVMMIHGLIVHEAVGHGRHTDSSVLLKLKSKLEASLLNILEDIRIEKATWTCYPGAKGMLHELVDYLANNKERDFLGQFVSMEDREKNAPAGSLLNYLLTFLRATCLGQNLKFGDDEIVVRAALGDDLVDKITVIATKSKDADSTEVCYQLMMQIIVLLGDAANPPEEPEYGDEGDDDSDGQSSGDSQSDSSESDAKGKSKQKSKGKSSSKDKPDENSDDKGDSKQNSKGNSDEDGDEKGDTKGGESNPSDEENGDDDTGSGNADSKPDVQKTAQEILDDTSDFKTGLEEMITQVVEAIVDKLPSGSSYSSTGVLDTNINKITATPAYSESSPYVFNRATSIRLSSRLEDLLEAKVETSESYADKGMLATRKLSRVRLLDQMVFTQETSESEGLDTSVFVLGDMSGSMDGDDAISMMDATLSLSLALEKHDIPFAVSYFEDRIHEVKSFGERFNKVKGRMQRAYSPRGCTPIFDSMVYAAGKAIETNCKRKILLVITDGTFGASSLDMVAFNNTLSKYQKDLEIRFVLIGSNMKGTYNYLVANKVKTGAAKTSADICKAVFDSMENVF